MNTKFQIGDKVIYNSVLCGRIKAKVVAIDTDSDILPQYTLKTTTRKNRIFYCGYIFKCDALHMSKR